MKATGVIVEYNPFHNGHKLHADAARQETNADLIIAVMSGNFLQRGEPAFINKWVRTEMALKNGVDLVVELPYSFATAHAPGFAKGAVQLLDALQCKAFCFGSEAGTIQPFHNSMTLLHTNTTAYDQMINTFMKEGISYPNALNRAYQILTHEQAANGPFIDLTKPNNILGFHYIEAADQLNSTIQPTTIQRVGAAYHDDTLTGQEIGSATGIRKDFFTTQQLTTTQQFVPKAAYDLLHKEYTAATTFGHWARVYPFLRMIILRDTPNRLIEIADITEGIENLFYRAALKHDHFDGFIQMVKSKRYTQTRIQRMLTHILTGYTYDMRKKFKAPTYLRLLGMNQTGRQYLHMEKKNFTLPLVSKASAFSDDALALDIHATNIYALSLSEPSLVNADYKTPPIFIGE